MKNWTKSIISGVLILFIILISALCFYFTRPLVVYIESPELRKLSLSPSKFVTPSYRLKVVSPDKYIQKNEALVVLDPLASVESESRVAVWGRVDDSADIIMVVDEEKMYSSFSSIPFVYPENDLYASKILSSNPTLIPVSYSGRISNVNIDSVLEAIEGYESVILFDPESAALLLDRAECNIIVDFRYYHALSRYKNVQRIVPDWDGALKEALSLDSDVSFDFTLR